MSVIVKGMKFPENCLKCDLRRYDANAGEEYCPITQVVCLNIGRQYDCPLVELPEKHGNLIDRDTLVKDLTNGIKAGLLLDGYEKYPNINNMDDCVECVKYANVVIEAEGMKE